MLCHTIRGQRANKIWPRHVEPLPRTDNQIHRETKMTIHRRAMRNHASYAALVLLSTAAFTGTALAGEKPPLMPDQPSALTTTSRVSATIEFGLPSIASAVERDVPRRLATIDERI